jgi:polysaccharide pyruvyl transferase WcaK-like protein
MRGHYCLFGAALETGNLGVSALALSVVLSLQQRLKDVLPVIYSYRRGNSRTTISRQSENGETIAESFDLLDIGASNSRRFYRSDTLAFLAIAMRLGGLGHEGARLLRTCSAALDISGGDSFTDLYGPRRFFDIAERKRICLRAGIPLTLLPQTYGPFRHKSTREQAADIVRKCRAAWARDQESFSVLKELLGGDFNPEQHRCGVDVAFALPTHTDDPTDEAMVQSWRSASNGPLVGLNISGLIYNNESSRSEFGLVADYREAIHKLVERLLRKQGCTVVLLPHVVADAKYESDSHACESVASRFPQEVGTRLFVAPSVRDPRRAKWIIRRFDWFCGTRMHATIGALSNEVPTAAIAYSMKTRGVFASCGSEKFVLDPRTLDTADLIDGLEAAFLARESQVEILRRAVPGVKRLAAEQMDQIAQLIIAAPGGK